MYATDKNKGDIYQAIMTSTIAQLVHLGLAGDRTTQEWLRNIHQFIKYQTTAPNKDRLIAATRTKLHQRP